MQVTAFHSPAYDEMKREERMASMYDSRDNIATRIWMEQERCKRLGVPYISGEERERLDHDRRAAEDKARYNAWAASPEGRKELAEEEERHFWDQYLRDKYRD